MIIDTQPPDPRTRRWPFLAGWSCAVITMALALFLTHNPVSQPPPIAVPSATPSASASPSVIVQRLPVGLKTTVQRIDSGRQPAIPILGHPFNVIYLDNGGQRIAVVLEDPILVDDTPDVMTPLR